MDYTDRQYLLSHAQRAALAHSDGAANSRTVDR